MQLSVGFYRSEFNKVLLKGTEKGEGILLSSQNPKQLILFFDKINYV